MCIVIIVCVRCSAFHLLLVLLQCGRSLVQVVQACQDVA